MADLHEYVTHLSGEIGPRPAGTEEEQRAALYISEQLSALSGLTTTTEDFHCNPDSSLSRVICSGVAAVVTILAMMLPVVTIPAIVLDVVCAVLFAAEVKGKPLISRLLNRGVSQNVVAKYEPVKTPQRSSRHRKVVVVANYDTGRVRKDYASSVVSILPVIYWAELVSMVLMPLILIVKLAAGLQGAALVVAYVILVVALVLSLLPIVSFALEKTAEYTEGANCNASGVAVLMEVAARVAAARDLPDEEEPLVFGEEVARDLGLIPEESKVVYDVEPNATMDTMEAPVDVPEVPADLADLVETPPDLLEPALVLEPTPIVQPSVLESQKKTTDVPDWFKKGQAQARKAPSEKPPQRSRYASALSAAEEEIQARDEARRAADEQLRERMRLSQKKTQEKPLQQKEEPSPTRATAKVAPPVSKEPLVSPDAGEAEKTPPITDGNSLSPNNSEQNERIVVKETPENTLKKSFDAFEIPDLPAFTEVPDIPTFRSEKTGKDDSSPSRQPAPHEGSDVASAPSPTEAVLTEEGRQKATVTPEIPEITLREEQRPLTGTPVAPSIEQLAEDTSSEAFASKEGPEQKSRKNPRPSLRKKRAITLPSIGISQELPRISLEERSQSAPLSEERPAHDGRVRDLSSVIPTVASPEKASALLSSLPSLASPQTTDTSSVGSQDPGLSGSINLTGSFTPMGATGAAAPIGDELITGSDDEDIYVEDVDDSAYVDQVTETGAFAGPGYVEMPKSRFGRLFGKRRRKDKSAEQTPQQWLDVDEDFDAREVGEARGGWESFREDDLGATTAFTPDFIDDEFDEGSHSSRRYEGGAYNPREFPNKEPDGAEPYASDSLSHSEPTSVFGRGLPADFVFETNTVEQTVDRFHSQRIDTEVWFVALGSELAGNGGMKAFMETHSSELKGAIVVELQSMGEGDLRLVEKEGTYRSKKPSSRMRRLVKKAGAPLGMTIPPAEITWMDGPSAYALKHSQQALHLVGMDGKKPALFAEAEDVIENIDDEKLALNADFVMELLKVI